jgi:iron(III) transport system substrate-binding protein
MNTTRIAVNLVLWGKMRRKTILAIAALLFGTISWDPASAAENWEDVVTAANTEGQVLLYSTKADADNAKLLDAFMKQFPHIQAKAVRLVGGAMVVKVDQELQAGALAADVILHAEHQWAIPKAKEGRLILPTGPAVTLWKGAEKFYQDGRVQVTAEPWVIGYNTKVVKDPPTDWDSLLGSREYSGRIGLNEVSGLTVAIWYDFIDKRIPDYFHQLAQLKPQIYPNSAPLTAGLSSGEIAWAPYSLASSIEPLKAKGAPVDYVIPKKGTWAIERSAMIFKEAPHPNAARVLLDFMMSQEGQQVLNTDRAGYTVAPGVKLTGALDVDLKQITSTDYTSYDSSFTKAWQNRVDQLFRH